LKQKVIIRAKEVFGLSEQETQSLANKAGLSLSFATQTTKVASSLLASAEFSTASEFSTELFPYDKPAKAGHEIKPKINAEKCTGIYTEVTAKPKGENHNADFIRTFNGFITAFPGKIIELCEAAIVSERMYFHIKLGKHLKKEPITALLIVLNKSLTCIQECLQMAGFILSHSLPGDMVIMWMIEHGLHEQKNISRVYHINEILYDLELPLLMTKKMGDSYAGA